jgi:hypothetical protein
MTAAPRALPLPPNDSVTQHNGSVVRLRGCPLAHIGPRNPHCTGLYGAPRAMRSYNWVQPQNHED